MNLFDMISQSQNGDAIANLASQFGLEPAQAEAVVRQLAPALGAGLHRNTSNGKGLSDLLGSLASGDHNRYVDDPAMLGSQETADHGNGILGHLFGSKQVSRKVADHASTKTGIGAVLLKKMLPVIATMVMSGLAKKAMGGGSREIADSIMTKTARRGGSMIGNLAGKAISSGLGKGLIGGLIGKMIMKLIFGGRKQSKSIFGSLLDRDGDGSYVDDLIDMATKGLLK
ncbi:MAG: DUF937 domain-containing protein [bacterium]|nr:DUF937 domain-containing protein [bacterium]